MKRFLPLLVLLVAGCGGAQEAETPVPHLVPADAALRTVIVGEIGEPDAAGRPIRAALLAGPMPTVRTTATVLTDTNCEPDFAGVSHCRNELELADGGTITVRHDHDMRRYSCLTPGEQVAIVPA